MAEHDSAPATVEPVEHDPASFVDIEYRTADRWGQRYAVPLKVALTEHKDAVIVSYSDGRPFEGAEAKADVREVKAEIREERAAEREAAKAEAAPAEKTKAKGD